MIRSTSFTLSKAMRFALILSVTLAWLGVFFALKPGDEYLGAVLVWAIGSGVLTYMLLVSTEYFEGLNPVPSRSSFLNVLLVAAPPALFAKYAIVATTGYAVLRFREILAASPIAALALFAVHRGAALFQRRRGQKRLLRVALLPDERARLERILEESGLSRSYAIAEGPAPQADGIVISRGAVREFSAHEGILDLHLRGVPVIDFRVLMNEIRQRIVSSSADAWFFLITAEPQGTLRQAYFQLKFLLEPAAAILLLALLLPLMLPIAVLVRLTSAGPAIYSQTRTGHRGRHFRLHKFRTMRLDSERSGPQWASEEDARITALGRVLRRTRLDELPQIWNIVRGELSFIGPRPERPEFYERLRTEIPLFGLRTLTRPGLTGWAQVNAGYAGTVEESRRKLEYDLYYMQRMSPRLDTIIVARTIGLLLGGGGGR